MATGKSYKEIKDRFLKDPKFRKEYEALGKAAYIPFTTDTTDLAAYLIALGAEAPTLDRSDPRRINYIFDLTEEQHQAVTGFRDGSGMVRALAMSQAKKMLMGLIKSGAEQEG